MSHMTFDILNIYSVIQPVPSLGFKLETISVQCQQEIITVSASLKLKKVSPMLINSSNKLSLLPRKV